MKMTYDKNADAIYITIDNGPYHHGKDLDEQRRLDYDIHGTVIGVELLCVSSGVTTDDLPHKTEIEKYLESQGIKVFA